MKMKQFLSIALVALFSIAIVGCEKDKPAEEPVLSVAPEGPINFTAAATEQFTFTVTTNQDSWKAVSNQSWCVVTESGNTFTVTAAVNSATTAPAAATITVTAGEATAKTISATQDAGVAQPTDPGTIAAENLVAYFPFESATASIEKGNGVTFAGAQGAASFAAAKRGNGYQGAESAAYLEYDLGATNVIKSLGAFTFAFWMNTPPVGPASIVTMNGGDSFMGAMQIMTEGNSNADSLDMKVYFYNTTSVWPGHDLRRKDKVFPPNEWFHFVFFYDDVTSTMGIYVNGELYLDNVRYANEDPDGEGPEAQPLLGTLTLGQDMTKLYIGAWTQLAKGIGDEWMKYYAGKLDELRVYNRGLSAAEIKALYDAEVGIADN